MHRPSCADCWANLLTLKAVRVIEAAAKALVWSRTGGQAGLSDVAAIANGGGTVDPLVEHEVDALCERLNGSER